MTRPSTVVALWALAWLIAGTPPVQPWTDWFVLLVASSVVTLAERRQVAAFTPAQPAERDMALAAE